MAVVKVVWCRLAIRVDIICKLFPILCHTAHKLKAVTWAHGQKIIQEKIE